MIKNNLLKKRHRTLPAALAHCCFWLAVACQLAGCQPKQKTDHDRFIRQQLKTSKYLPFFRHYTRDSVAYFKPVRIGIDPVNDIRFELFFLFKEDCEEAIYLILQQPVDGHWYDRYGECQYQFIHYVDEFYPLHPQVWPPLDQTVFNLDMGKAVRNLSIRDKSKFVRTLFESTLKAKPVTVSNLDSLFAELRWFNDEQSKPKLYDQLKQALNSKDTYCYSSVLLENGIWKVQFINDQIRIILLNRRNMMCFKL